MSSSILQRSVLALLWLGYSASGLLMVLAALLPSDPLLAVVRMYLLYLLGASLLGFLSMGLTVRTYQTWKCYRAFSGAVPKRLSRVVMVSFWLSMATLLIAFLGSRQSGSVSMRLGALAIGGFGLGWYSIFVASIVSAIQVAMFPPHEKKRLGLFPPVRHSE